MKMMLPENVRRSLQTESERLGTRRVIVLGYTPRVARQRRKLISQLKQAGFCACYSGEFGDSLSRWHTQWIAAADYKRSLERFARKCLGDTIYFIRKSKFLGKLNYASDTEDAIYLLCDYEITENTYAFFEEFQIMTDSPSFRELLFYYDSVRGEAYQLQKPLLGYYEYHVAWNCNLKCKGCSHYSNLHSTPLFGDFAQYKKHLSRLKELFSDVREIQLLGGSRFLILNCRLF